MKSGVSLPVCLLVLGGLASGCPSGPEPREPGPRASNVDEGRRIWAPEVRASDVKAEEDVFYITDSVAIRDTEANAQHDLRKKALEKSVELTVRDILRDASLFSSNENEIRRLFVSQPEKYIETADVVEKSLFGDGRNLGVRLRVKVARGKVQKGLQEEGILRISTMRVILIVRKPAAGAANVSELADGYLDDLAEGLSRELGDRGFRPKLWKDVRLSVAERRDDSDRDLDHMLVKYVEESDWRKPEDERYELPLLLLRTEGRLLVGFRILELKKVDLAYHATMRADSYDLLNGQSLGYDVLSDRRPIGHDTILAARQALVSDVSTKLMHKHATKLVELLERERRRDKDRKDYQFTFEGYGEPEIARIESLLAGVVAEDVDVENDGKTLRASARVARDPIPLRDEVVRTLKLVGLKSRTPRRSGNSFTFVKE